MPSNVTQAREHLLSALEADLIGPYDLPANRSDTPDELLRLPPSRWYLTGFLAPMEAREVTEPTDDEMAAGPDHDDEDGTSPDAGPKRKHFLPASLGLSVLLQPAEGKEPLRATVRWADYLAEDHQVVETVIVDPEPRRLFSPTRDADEIRDAMSPLALFPEGGNRLLNLRSAFVEGVGDGEADPDLIAALVVEETRLVLQRQNLLLTWLTSERTHPGGRRALMLVGGGFDPSPLVKNEPLVMRSCA